MALVLLFLKWKLLWILLLFQTNAQSMEVKIKMAAEAEANNVLTVSLLKTLSSNKEATENIFFSPWSISTALGMVAAGAKGKTLEEISNCFAWKSQTSSDLSFALARLARNVVNQSQSSTENILNLANKLWIDNNFAVLGAFKTSLQKNYQAEVGISDLSGNSEVARGEINDWVEEHTAHKIKDLFPEGSITAATRLVLANAVYFKGQWENKFDKFYTHDNLFHLYGDKTISVPMMFLNKEFKTYYDNERACKILEMPYAGKHFSMLIALPDQLDGVNKLIESLTPQLVTKWFTSTSDLKEFDVRLPKFKISDQINLKETFEKIGIKNIFLDTADLSGITGERNLYVSGAMHKAFAEVNEEGTEAAAATGFGIVFYSMPPQFLVNHPFIFFIKHNPTNAIVFMGKVTDPSKE